MIAAHSPNGFMERLRRRGSFRLDVGRPYYFAPLLSFFGDQLAEVDSWTGERDSAEISQPGLDLGIGEAVIDFLV